MNCLSHQLKTALIALAFVIGLLVSCQPLHAVTYFVRTSGSDSNTGLTPLTAWQTIDKAANTMIAGDTVYVGAGTYTERVTPSNDGTSLLPIRFIADTTGAQTGDAGPVVVTNPGADVFDVSGDDYIHIIGFTITGGNNGVDWGNSDGGRIESCEIYSNTREGIEVSDSELTIISSKIFNNGRTGIEIDDCLVTITDCEIYNNDPEDDDVSKGYGIYAKDKDTVLIVRRCHIYSNNEDNIRIDEATSTIVNCLIRASVRSETDGIQINDSDANVSIWHCTIVSNADDAIDVNNGTVTVTNCILANHTGNGLRRDGGSLTHTYNIVYGNGEGNFFNTSQSTGEDTSNPLFVGASDFHLQASSPAVDSGIDASAQTTIDLEGNARPQAAGWDMGCYEGSPVVLFTDVSSGAGFNLQTTSGEEYGSGFHWGDFDGDGDLDAIATGNSAKIYDNNGGINFVVSAFGGGNVRRQGALADFDNDGDLDFWAASIGSNDVEGWYKNNGSGQFIFIGNAGLSSPSNNEAAAVADVNWDGWCDVLMLSGNANWLGTHNGSSASIVFNESSGLVYGFNDAGDFGDGNYCSSGDVNNDGFLDFFYHWNGGRLFLSEGDGTYRRMNAPGNIIVTTDDLKKCGSAWGDYDNDGDLDLFVPRYDSGFTGYLWQQQSNGTFVDVTLAANILDLSGQRSCCWGDYDNDGFLDLYITTQAGGNKLYRNLGGGSFSVVLEGADATGINHDATFVDFDNDGDLDLSVARQGDSNVLLQNNLKEFTYATMNDYLKVWVKGVGVGGTNRAAIGVRVELYDSAGTTFIARRDVGLARGIAGTEPVWLHFGGVNPATTYIVRTYFVSGVKEVTVTPGTASATIGSVTISQMITIEEDAPDHRVIFWKEDDPLSP